MPPKQSTTKASKALSKSKKLREEAGFQADGVVTAPTVELNSLCPSTIALYTDTFTCFKRFYAALEEKDELGLLPNSPKSPEDVFMVDGTSLDYDSFLAFVTYKALTSSGGLLGVLPTVDTLLKFADSVHRYMLYKSGRGIDEVVRRQVRGAIRLKLPKRFPIEHLARLKRYPDWETMAIVAYTAMSPGYQTTYTWTRLQILAHLAITIQNGLRVHALLPVKGSGRSILWGDAVIGVYKDENGGNNRITIAFDACNGKTDTSKDLVVVCECTDLPWADPVLLLFVLAYFKDALPADHSLPELLDPKLFDKPGLGSYLKLRFNPAKAQEPVFTQKRNADKMRSWNTDAPRGHLRDLSRLAGLPVHMTYHGLKRMGQQTMKDDGMSCRVVQADL
jgi:hypothetical protein